MINFSTFLEATFRRPNKWRTSYSGNLKTTVAPKTNYNNHVSLPKDEPEATNPKKSHWLDKAIADIQSPESVEKMRQMVKNAKYTKEDIIIEKAASRNLLGKRVTINNPKITSWHGRTGRVSRIFNNGYIGVKFRHVDHEVELHPNDVGKIHPGI